MQETKTGKNTSSGEEKVEVIAKEKAENVRCNVFYQTN